MKQKYDNTEVDTTPINNSTANWCGAILIIFLFIASMCSCGESIPSQYEGYKKINSFQFENHDYIVLGDYTGHTTVHNPNCSNLKCLNPCK